MKKVIHKLAQTEYIILTKGRNGRLKLGVEAIEINLGKALISIEENLNLVECINNPKPCPLMTSCCKLKGILSKSLQSFVNELSQYTLRLLTKCQQSLFLCKIMIESQSYNLRF